NAAVSRWRRCPLEHLERFVRRGEIHSRTARGVSPGVSTTLLHRRSLLHRDAGVAARGSGLGLDRSGLGEAAADGCSRTALRRTHSATAEWRSDVAIPFLRDIDASRDTTALHQPRLRRTATRGWNHP